MHGWVRAISSKCLGSFTSSWCYSIAKNISSINDGWKAVLTEVLALKDLFLDEDEDSETYIL
jgi:hypothetical protein